MGNACDVVYKIICPDPEENIYNTKLEEDASLLPKKQWKKKNNSIRQHHFQKIR